jgi:hypothetical protein
LGNGAGFVTSGVARPPGAIPFSSLPPRGTTTRGAYLNVGSFVQEGSSFVTGLDGASPVLDINSSGNITFSNGPGLVAPTAWLELNLQGGFVSGVVNVEALDITYASSSGGADLSGTINGVAGPAAAGAGFIGPQPSAQFRINSCPVHSVNCVLLPTESLPTASPLNDLLVGGLFTPDDQDDTLLPIVSNEYIESLTAPALEDPQQQDCGDKPGEKPCKEE